MRTMILAIVVAFAGAGTLDLFAPDGQRIGQVREGMGNTVDVYDAESRRVGWGRINTDGSVELFDMKGNRLGSLILDRGSLRLDRPRR